MRLQIHTVVVVLRFVANKNVAACSSLSRKFNVGVKSLGAILFVLKSSFDVINGATLGQLFSFRYYRLLGPDNSLCGDHLGYCRVLSSTPGLCPLDARMAYSCPQLKTSPESPTIPWREGKPPPAENQFSRRKDPST